MHRNEQTLSISTNEMESDEERSTIFRQDHETQTCRCAQRSETRPYDFNDLSSSEYDTDSYDNETSEYYCDEDGYDEAITENDFSSDWSDDYSESNVSNEANEPDLPETDADQAPRSGSFCRCHAIRTYPCRITSENPQCYFTDEISNDEFDEVVSPDTNQCRFYEESSYDSDDSSLEITNQINESRRRSTDILPNRYQANEYESSEYETSSYDTED